MEKIAENCKFSKKCGLSRQSLDRIGVRLCEIGAQFTLSERHFNRISYFLIS